MSATTGSIVEPAPEVQPPATAPPAQAETKPSFAWRRWALVAAVLVILLLIWAVYGRRSNGAAVQTARTTVVKRGDFVRSLRVHGVVEAVQFYSVTAPRLRGQRGMDYGSLVITKLVSGGTQVKPGDVLVEFDRQNQIKNALDRQADYNDFLEQIKRKRAEQATQEAVDRTDLRRAENAVASAKLDLRKNEVVSKIDQEKNEQTLAEAEANLQQLRETMELKRRARQADLHVLEIQRDRARTNMIYAQKNSEKLQVRSQIGGVVVLNSDWRAGTMAEFQEGDSVDAGRPIMQIVNPAAMQVRARVNQADVAYLEEGQPVQIGLDAYPDLSFPGKLERIGAIGITSNMSQRVHTFIAVFSIVGSEPRLMPDLSAAVDIELQRASRVLLAPRDAVVETNDSAYVVVKNGSSTERRVVKLGPKSATEVVIESGIDEGATVVRNPNS